jgi:hypothetical protein
MFLKGDDRTAPTATRRRRPSGPALEKVLASLRNTGSLVATVRIHPDGALQIDLAPPIARAGESPGANADDPALTAWAAQQGIEL